MINSPGIATDNRSEALLHWLPGVLGHRPGDIRPVSGDASFRRYFRVRAGESSFIAMDAPPELEKLRPFIHAAGLLQQAGVNVPRIFAVDEAQGFLLMSDFGDVSYLQQLAAGDADALYADALETLVRMQRGIDAAGCGLPAYDQALLQRELELFPVWFLAGLLGLELSRGEQTLYQRLSLNLMASALQQPAVVVHRDFHSRNLMVTGECNPGVLDFQDAVVGPVTYDLVSLLRDCYIAWPDTRVRRWLDDYRQRLADGGACPATDGETFQRWFDLMGLQRHLKAVGIFARLHLRDGKSGYLPHIPRTLRYILDVAGRYPETAEFRRFLDLRVCPLLNEAAA
ncbi:MULTISPECIES: aminoglycoside phosphotransferase family protein [Methylococcus]|uniref:Phosphotransferase n=1 Tax=Methylococcus capsulatus TaxID=414 RepID=A0ABZ2F6N4_METCP|nr:MULTISPECIES: phosphotransferase [Methylococcus]MDF9392327.1 aminoglycoside phosphotransferase [Methylococcus capsulatus]